MSLAGRTGLCDLHTGDVVAGRPRVPRSRRLVPSRRSRFRRRRGRQAHRSTPIAGAHLVVAGHDHQVAAYVAGADRARLPVRVAGHGRRHHPHRARSGRRRDRPRHRGHRRDDRQHRRRRPADGDDGRAHRTDPRAHLPASRCGRPRRTAGPSPSGPSTRAPDPDLACRASPTGWSRSRGIGDDTDGAALWAAAVAATDDAHRRGDRAVRRAVRPADGRRRRRRMAQRPDDRGGRRRRFPTARRSRFGEPGAVGAACLAGISAGMLDGPFADCAGTTRRSMTMSMTTTPVLEARGVVKTFGMVNALQGADFIVDAGTVTALIGDNGAGKSTLVKVLSGVHPPDGGEILLDGVPVDVPLAARRPPDGDRDRLPGPRPGAAPRRRRQRVPRSGDPARPGVHQQAGDAQADDHRLQRARRDDRAGPLRPRGAAVGRPAPVGRHRPLGAVGQAGDLLRRADGRPRRDPDSTRARPHPHGSAIKALASF